MEEEQYCLKWNNHQSTLLTVLTGLMDTERLADCILSAEGKMLKAHQVIISACSPYLEKLLNESRQPGYMPILIFSDLVFDELVAMKEYMYKGEVNIRQDALDSFLKAACNLQIKGLADGGGGGDEGGGGGGGKRKAPPEIVDSSPARAGRRRRRESRESDHTQDMIPQEPQLPQPVPAKKQNVFTAKVEPFEPAPVVKMEPIMDQPPMPQPQIQHAPQLVMKPEPQDHHEPETHDLTGLDDDEDYDYDMPGTSQPDLSQDISNWQMDNSMHSAEDFAASQSMNTSQPGQSSQGDEEIIASIMKNQKYLLPAGEAPPPPRNENVIEEGSLNEFGKLALKSIVIPTPTKHKFICSNCHRMYVHARSLKKHLQYECGKPPSFPCSACPYRAKHKQNLKAHMILKHSQKNL